MLIQKMRSIRTAFHSSDIIVLVVVVVVVVVVVEEEEEIVQLNLPSKNQARQAPTPKHAPHLFGQPLLLIPC